MDKPNEVKPSLYSIDGKKAFIDPITGEPYWMPITIQIGMHVSGDIAFVKEIEGRQYDA